MARPPAGTSVRMSVSEAVDSRVSARAFLDRPVPRTLVEDILRRAARAPSGGNLQPWLARLVEGEEIAALKTRMRARVAELPDGEPMAHGFYPPTLKPAYLARRRRNGEILYGALGIDRRDPVARKAWIDENFQFFGAPAGVLLFIERSSTPYQWIDLGIYLQTVLLLLREAGLDACPQADWAMYAATVAAFLDAPPDLMLICGIAIGHADPNRPENFVRTERDDPLAAFAIS
ncbi:nitroreductase [Ancylobacter sp. 3268]|nr:nitroreductase [Ancylobacter sp. 3268]